MNKNIKDRFISKYSSMNKK